MSLNVDLLDSPNTFQTLPLRDADVRLLRQLDLPLPATALLQELITDTPWREQAITVWGKRHLQPRLIAWFGDAGRSYRYSGITMVPLPWTARLLELRALIEAACEHSFNSVLLNFYRNERDSMGLHSDDEPELGPRPVIASLSLGQMRVLSFKHRHQPQVPRVRLPLASGNLLLMRGDTQTHWLHGIAKSTQPMGPRVNLTFRHIVLGDGDVERERVAAGRK